MVLDRELPLALCVVILSWLIDDDAGCCSCLRCCNGCLLLMWFVVEPVDDGNADKCCHNYYSSKATDKKTLLYLCLSLVRIVFAYQ